MELKRSELAELLNLSPKQVTTLSNNGVFVYGSKKGLYNVKLCIQNFIEYSAEEILKNKVTPENQNIKESLDYWKMQRQRISALKEMNKVINIEDAERIMTNRLIQIRDILTTIEATWAPYLISLEDLKTSQKVVSNLLDTVFIQISNLSDITLEEPEEIIEEEEEEEDDV
jgi:hypothetical protein